MSNFDGLLANRKNLATLCGITTMSNGNPVEQEPCIIPLGDAILRLATARDDGMNTQAALVIWQGGIYDEKACLNFASQLGEKLASR